MRFSQIIIGLFFHLTVTAQEAKIYVSDAGNFSDPPWKIIRYDIDGSNPILFINQNLAWPQDILFLEDANVVLISNLNSGRITKHDATTGAFIENFAQNISGPTRMKIGPDSLLYVLQWKGNGKVKRYNLDGTYVDDFTAAGVDQSIGLDWDSNGNLYVSSYKGASVRKFDTSGKDLGLFINFNLLGPTNIWFDESGDLLVTDYSGTAVKRFSASGSYKGEFLKGLQQAEGVDFFPNGDILIGDGSSSSVKLYDSGGNFVKDLVPSGSGGLMTPNAVVIRGEIPLGFHGRYIQNRFITPTIGSNFKIRTGTPGAVLRIEIHNLTGNLTETLTAEEGADISAVHLPAGIYIVSATTKEGLVYRQKILVKH